MKYPLVLIAWEDSAQPIAGWHYLDGVDESVISVRSVGYLIKSDSKVKILAPNLAEEGTQSAQACGVIRIPTRCVTKLIRLKEPS